MQEEVSRITAELYKAIVAIIDERVKEIRVTREDFDELKGIVGELAQAQAETEKRLGELAQAQTRTEKELRTLAREVGSLSTTIGFGLEDIARVVLPGYLERHHNVYVKELERRFFRVNKTRVEINLYGEGRKDSKEIIILGEVKSRIYQKEVRKFIQNISKVVPKIEHEILKVMFGYFIHPEAMELAGEQGIILVASYQR